jgi:hypothetical protein
MKYKKGQSGNTAGRPKGTPNKSTEYLRNLFKLFLERNAETLQADFDQLEPKDRLSFIERLAKFVIPPPFSPQNLTEDQLNQVLTYLKMNRDEQITKN